MRPFQKRTAAAAIVIATLAPTAQAQITYKITDLGAAPGFDNSSARKIGPSGHIVGTSSKGGNTFATVFTPGGPTLLPVSPSATRSEATSVSADGTIVGFQTTDGIERPTRWRPLAGGGYSLEFFDGPGRLFDISSSNVAVGTNGNQAFYWDSSAAGPLLNSGATSSAAQGATDSGHIVGRAVFGSTTFAARWDSPSANPSLFQVGPSTFNAFTGVNNARTAIGFFRNGGVNQGFLWRDSAASAVVIPLLPSTFTGNAIGINSLEQVVGSSTGAGFALAYIWDATNGSRSLNSLIDPSTPGWNLQAAFSIDDSGTIVGFGTFNGQTRAFRADPIPEPASLTALALAAALLANRKRKKA